MANIKTVHDRYTYYVTVICYHEIAFVIRFRENSHEVNVYKINSS